MLDINFYPVRNLLKQKKLPSAVFEILTRENQDDLANKLAMLGIVISHGDIVDPFQFSDMAWAMKEKIATDGHQFNPETIQEMTKIMDMFNYLRKIEVYGEVREDD